MSIRAEVCAICFERWFGSQVHTEMRQREDGKYVCKIHKYDGKEVT